MRARVLTALVVAPLVLAAVASTSPWPVLALASVALALALVEIRRMLGHRWPAAVPFLLFLGLVQGQLSGKLPGATGVAAAGGLFLVGVLAAWWWTARRRGEAVSVLLSGAWAAMPIFGLFWLHQSRLGPGAWQASSPILLALLPIWAGDIAAMLVGRSFGKRPLMPSVSPKKTVEGSVGNLLAACLAGLAVGRWVGVDLSVGLACGVAAGTLGQAGDLFESFVKRAAGMKDSGTLLPGHGGIMDRIDSVLFAAPAVAGIVAWAGQR